MGNSLQGNREEAILILIKIFVFLFGIVLEYDEHRVRSGNLLTDLRLLCIKINRGG